MKVVSNKSKKSIVFKGKVIAPAGILLLNDDGSVIESIEAESALAEAKKYTDAVLSKQQSETKKETLSTIEEAKKYTDDAVKKLEEKVPKLDFDKDTNTLNITA